MQDTSENRNASSETLKRHLKHHMEEFLTTHIKHFLFCVKKTQLCH